MIHLAHVRERLDELREELENWPGWHESAAVRADVTEFFQRMGWASKWECDWVVRNQLARSPRADLYANQLVAANDEAGLNE